MELVVTQVQRCIDWLEWLKVNVDLLFFTLFCQDCAGVHHKSIWWYLHKGYNRSIAVLQSANKMQQCIKLLATLGKRMLQYSRREADLVVQLQTLLC